MLYIDKSLMELNEKFEYITEEEIKKVFSDFENFKEKEVSEQEKEVIDLATIFLKDDYISTDIFSKYDADELDIILDKVINELDAAINNENSLIHDKIINSRLYVNLTEANGTLINKLPVSALLF